MTREPGSTPETVAMNTTVAAMVFRMKPLPRRHRIAHLRALIRRLSPDSIRGPQLAALLREEIALLGGGKQGCAR